MTAHRIHEDLFEAHGQSLEGKLPDPGAGGTIFPKGSLLICEMVTAAAEARTLADPDRSGVFLTLNLKTDGGNCTVTAATAVNAAGNTTLTFADAGDTAVFVSIPDGASAYKWKIVGNDGVALS